VALRRPLAVRVAATGHLLLRDHAAERVEQGGTSTSLRRPCLVERREALRSEPRHDLLRGPTRLDSDQTQPPNRRWIVEPYHRSREINYVLSPRFVPSGGGIGVRHLARPSTLEQ